MCAALVALANNVFELVPKKQQQESSTRQVTMMMTSRFTVLYFDSSLVVLQFHTGPAALFPKFFGAVVPKTTPLFLRNQPKDGTKLHTPFRGLPLARFASLPPPSAHSSSALRVGRRRVMVARGCAIHNCVGMQLSETHAGTIIKSVLPSLCIHVCNDGLFNSSVLRQVVYLQTLRFRRSVTLPCCICFAPFAN